MIRSDGWQEHNIWEHSATVQGLYTRRCRKEAEEMTCHAQAAGLLLSRVEPGDTLLDVGCGSGYFYHSLADRNIAVEYWGMDATEKLLNIGRDIMPQYGLAPERLLHMRLDDLAGEVDHIVCMNVLSNIDNYHRPLERMLRCARKTVTLRESFADRASYTWVRDHYLDKGHELCVHVNTYNRNEVLEFIQQRGFSARSIVDERTQGKPEMVIDHPHYWTFIVAERTAPY